MSAPACEGLLANSKAVSKSNLYRLLTPAFNEKSLRNQAPVIEMYADKVIKRLNALYNAEIQNGKTVVVNFLDWCNFYTMDIIGDLALGESFYCIDGR